MKLGDDLRAMDRVDLQNEKEKIQEELSTLLGDRTVSLHLLLELERELTLREEQPY